MLVYFDPSSYTETETSGEITCVNASDANDRHVVPIRTRKQAQAVIDALKDQIKHGVAGKNGRFRKVQGTFFRIENTADGIIRSESGKETPVRMDFDLSGTSMPDRGVCIAVGEFVDGALMVERMTLAPIAPTPQPMPQPTISDS